MKILILGYSSLCKRKIVPALKEKLNNAFEGKLKLKFHVAPPLFSPKDPNTGKLKKITMAYSHLKMTMVAK